MPTMVGNREGFAPAGGWIGRSQRAHVNMVENLLPFAALVLTVVVANKGSSTTALAAQLFFFARLAHAVFYIAGIAWLRTLAFAVGLVGMIMLLAALAS